MLQSKDLKPPCGTSLILSGVNLILSYGDVVSIIGLSGSGRTTLLKDIYYLARPQSGTRRVPCRASPRKRRVRSRRVN